MTKIEINKEESINGQVKWRVYDKNGGLWCDSLKGELWRASSEGVETMSLIHKALQVLSNAIEAE